MSTLSIRTRLILAFSLMLALLVTVAAVALQRFDALSASMNHFVDHQARISFLAQRANQHAQHAAMYLLRLLQTPDREQRVPLYLAMDAALAKSDAAIGGLERAALVEGGDDDIRHLVAIRLQYGDSFQETVELIEIEGLVPARRHFDEKTDALLTSLLEETLTIDGHRRDLMQIQVEEIEARMQGARRLVWLITACAVVMSAALAMLIARGIARPVQRAVMVAESIASGDYDRPVAPGRGREIGALMRALDVMRNSIVSRERRILKLAYIDELTQLPNRTRFLEVMEQALHNGPFALFLMDIDRFGAINSALGHAVGDRLLTDIAQRLRSLVPARHFVARLGSDQFVILTDDSDRNAAGAFARSLLAGFRSPMTMDGQRLDVEARLGIVLFPTDGASISTLLRRADLAVALAKHRHQGIAFGSESAAEHPHEHLSLIGEMRDAIANNQFTTHFQPKMRLATHEIMGVEALLRWQHPDRGLVSPGAFIPFAEQTGFIREITPWLLRTVVKQASEWYRSGLELVTSVNLSTLDLINPALVTDVRQLLEETGLPARLLCLEITESALMDDPEAALRHLDDLAALGVKLSIDDYGSGQASLGYVQRLPVHELKIDRAFVSAVDQLPKNAAIVRSTILLCHELALSVVAEGAETPDEIAWLEENGCDIVQGYGIARPMPAAAFSDWLKARLTG